MRVKTLLIVTCSAIVALPAIAQQTAPRPASPTTYPTPVTADPSPTATPQPSNPTPSVRRPSRPQGADGSAVELVTEVKLPPPPKPVEYPAFARRDPWTVGALDPADAGLGGNPWRGASGAFLST